MRAGHRDQRRIAAVLATGLWLMLLAARAFAQSAPELISVGDHHLEAIVQGEGSPVVVFESGFAGGMSLWRRVQERVAERTRTLAYERAGLGRSELGPAPRTAIQIAAELHELLERQRISEPIVLVGHSAGGMYARVFASKYPTRIGALVLVDPATESYYERLRAETPDDWKNASLRMTQGQRQQWEALPSAMHEAAGAWPLPPVPVTIFSASKPLGSWPLESATDVAALLSEHDALASRIAGVERITIESANHLSVLTAPQLSERILLLVDGIRASGR